MQLFALVVVIATGASCGPSMPTSRICPASPVAAIAIPEPSPPPAPEASEHEKDESLRARRDRLRLQALAAQATALAAEIEQQALTVNESISALNKCSPRWSVVGAMMENMPLSAMNFSTKFLRDLSADWMQRSRAAERPLPTDVDHDALVLADERTSAARNWQLYREFMSNTVIPPDTNANLRPIAARVDATQTELDAVADGGRTFAAMLRAPQPPIPEWTAIAAHLDATIQSEHDLAAKLRGIASKWLSLVGKCTIVPATSIASVTADTTAVEQGVKAIRAHMEALESTAPFVSLRALRWSTAGPVPGMHCTQIVQPSDPHGWQTTFLCSYVDWGFVWSYQGQVDGMRCARFWEPGDSHNWRNSYLCVPVDKNIVPFFSFASASAPVSTCVQTAAPTDPEGWGDNHLCVLWLDPSSTRTAYSFGEWKKLGKCGIQPLEVGKGIVEAGIAIETGSTWGTIKGAYDIEAGIQEIVGSDGACAQAVDSMRQKDREGADRARQSVERATREQRAVDQERFMRDLTSNSSHDILRESTPDRSSRDE